MAAATVTSKGQVTIPREIREFLGVNEGSRLEFTLERDGTVRMRKLGQSLLRLAGRLKRPDVKAASIEEMRLSIADHLAAEDDRIRRSF